MKMKKLLALILAAGLALTACGGEETEAETEAETREASETSQTSDSQDSSSEEDSEKASSESSDESEPVEIIFWHAMNGAQEDSLVKLTDEFMAENPNITVNLQNQSSYQDLSQKLTSTLQSPDNLPTITQAYPDWMVPMIQSDLVVDLEPMINNSDEDIAFDNWEDVIKGFREGVENEEGQILAMPFNKSTEVLWYNKTLLDELGLEVPTTYEELAEVSQAIYEAKSIPGCGFDSLSNYYTTYLYNHGVEFDKNLDVTGQVSQDAVNYYLDGIKEGYFRIAGADGYMSGPLANEQVGMYVGSNAGEGYVAEGVGDKFEYAAAPYPAQYSVQQGTDIYMFSTADENQQVAAFQYMMYLTNADSQVTWAIDTGYIPVRTSAVDSEEYSTSDSAVAPILAEATQDLFSTPTKLGSQQAYNDVGAMLEGILADPENADVEATLENFQVQFDAAWQ